MRLRLCASFLVLLQSIFAPNLSLAQSSVGFEKEVYYLEDANYTPGANYAMQGEFYFRPGNDSVLAAPHGDFDIGTFEIVRELCERHPQWTCVLATHFRSEGASAQPFNVNRPTLLNHDDCSSPHPLAYRVFAAWMEKVKRITPRLYVEIHGNARDESADHIEVAHKGYQPEKLKTLLSHPMFAIENFDEIWFKASQNKECGAMQAMTKSLHFELPASLRLGELGRNSAVGVLDAGLKKVEAQLRRP